MALSLAWKSYGVRLWNSHVNCSIKPIPFTEIGTPYKSSTIGALQRQEADIFQYLFDIYPDALPFEPGIIGPIYHMRRSQQKELQPTIQREISSFVENFDEVSYAYFGIIALIYCIAFTVMEFILHTDHQVSFDTLHLFFNIALATIFEQINCNTSRMTLRILLVSFGLFIFVVMYGIVKTDICRNIFSLSSFPHFSLWHNRLFSQLIHRSLPLLTTQHRTQQ